MSLVGLTPAHKSNIGNDGAVLNCILRKSTFHSLEMHSQFSMLEKYINEYIRVEIKYWEQTKEQKKMAENGYVFRTFGLVGAD